MKEHGLVNHAPRAHVYPMHRTNAAGQRITVFYAGIRRAYDEREALSYCQPSREAAEAVCAAFLATGERPPSGMKRGPKPGSRNSVRRQKRTTDSARIGSKSVVRAPRAFEERAVEPGKVIPMPRPDRTAHLREIWRRLA